MNLPTLSQLCLKLIAKAPTSFISQDSLQRPYSAYSAPQLSACSQLLVDYISAAGRLTDDVFPLQAFDTARSFLSLRNSKVSAKYLLSVLRVCPGLTELDVSGCLPVDDDVVASILDLCPQLQNLCIRNCRKVTDASLEHIVSKSNSIKILNIGGNINITDAGLQRFITQYSQSFSLLELHVSGLPITSELLTLVSQRCHSLKNVSIGYAIITAQTFEDFIKEIGKDLQALSIAWVETLIPLDGGGGVTSMSSVDFLEIVRTHCAQLVSLDLTGMKSVNFSALCNIIDYKIKQREKFPNEWNGLEVIKIKFLPINKQQMEQLRVTYPNISFET